MKGDVLLGPIVAILLLIAWIVIIVTALTFTPRLRSGWSRAALVTGAALSVPLYVFVPMWLEEARSHRNMVQSRRVADQSSALYARLCAQPQELSVTRVSESDSPVDLQVKEGSFLYGLGVMMPLRLGGPPVCWTDPGSTNCPRPPLANVQWEFRCDPAGNAECLRWNYSVGHQVRTRIPAMTAPFVLVVSKPDRIDPFIERFRIALVDATSSAPLGETLVYQKTMTPRPDEVGQEPRHCPPRDVAIGTLLERALVLRK